MTGLSKEVRGRKSNVQVNTTGVIAYRRSKRKEKRSYLIELLDSENKYVMMSEFQHSPL